MAYILDISTVVPEFPIEKKEIEHFYSKIFSRERSPNFFKKLSLLNEKTRISKRYSCIPDFGGNDAELFTNGIFNQPVDKRMAVYKEKIMPLASKAIDKLLSENRIDPKDITHLITVSCTGLYAPGFEFAVAKQYGIQHTEKLAINFMGCYAALKALKQANYIAEADPAACVLIVSAELCTLHFTPSDLDEDVVANLLFADGAAATLVCGKKNKHTQDKIALSIEAISSAYIPNTSDLMTWDVTSSGFKMYLSKYIASSIRGNIKQVFMDFLKSGKQNVDYWAVHPGGVKIVEAVQSALELAEKDLEDSMHVLQNFGNMSSPTILFILNRIFSKIRESQQPAGKKIMACAFGPGINVERISFSSVNTSTFKINTISKPHSVAAQI